MSGIGELASKAKDVLVAIGSAPQPTDTPFVKNARPFAIYIGILALAAMGILAVNKGDQITSCAVVGAIPIILQQYGAQRSADNQARMKAASDDKKTTTGAASTDIKTAADAAATAGE